MAISKLIFSAKYDCFRFFLFQEDSGELLVSLSFLPTSEKLSVVVMKVQDLKPRDHVPKDKEKGKGFRYFLVPITRLMPHLDEAPTVASGGTKTCKEIVTLEVNENVCS